MMAKLSALSPLSKALIAACVLILLIALSGSTYAWYLGDRIAPNTWIGEIPVGGLTRDDAVDRMQEVLDALMVNGIRLSIDGFSEIIRPENIDFDLNVAEAVEQAFARGHGSGWLQNTFQRLIALVSRYRLDVPVRFDTAALNSELTDIAFLTTLARQDIRLQASGTSVTLLTDVRPGRTIDHEEAIAGIADTLHCLDTRPIVLTLQDDPPRADPATADEALAAARRMMARNLTLQYENLFFSITRARIGSWLANEYEDNRLIAGLDRVVIAQYVTNIATRLYVAPEPPQISTTDGRITGFTPATMGRAVAEDELIVRIVEALEARADNEPNGNVVTIPTKATTVALTGLDTEAGIKELIGAATTPFTGSPTNRIANIKNGVRFLSGTVVRPGEEFSTLETLGTIDNTTGYLPELVIKGDRTVPEYGGGLCQVSTTLFRAALNASLPITARRNHSYRVSYYEHDGDGNYIGPGLDATIYEPNPDFRFRNDTDHSVLIIGYVVGDKITFEFYGTRDGRTSEIIGPTLLLETEPGEPLYIETTELPPGTTRKVETAHSGGHATATYIITYPGGHTNEQTFDSWYRRWPAQYLVGVAQLSSPSLDPSVSPMP